MKTIQILKTYAIAALAISGGLVSAPADAVISLDATDAICTSDASGGNNSVFLTGCGKTGLTEYYGADRSAGTDSGPYADDYSTSFGSGGTTATITWGGPDSISCPTCYLLAKDGNSTPNWFLFDLNGWNGTETIDIAALFYFTNPSGQTNVQAFSHLSIYGSSGSSSSSAGGQGSSSSSSSGNQVPEPASSLVLLGLGLLGLGFGRRLAK